MFTQPGRYLFLIIPFLFLPCLVSGLAGCQGKVEDEKPQLNEVVFYNWKDFTDISILKDFEKETGIKVVLKEYETRDMCIAELQTNPELCDVLILDTYNIPYLKNQKLIKEFDSNKIPNSKFVDLSVKNYLAKDQIHMPPYVTGANGFMINTKYVPANTDSWNVFGDSKYSNKIILLDDLREALAAVLGMSDFSINEMDPGKLEIVQQNAMALKKNGVIFGETFTNIDKMLTDEKWIAQTYNGDFVYKTKGRNEFKFIFPKEGFLKWIVIFALHSDAKNPEGAHKFVDYMLRPEIAARSATTFSYQTPITGANKYMPKELGSNKIIHPPASVMARGETARELGESTTKFQKIFNSMKK